jgi:hypothetical protein
MAKQTEQKTLAELVAGGMEPMVAAASMGIAPEAAKTIVKSPLFQALVEKNQTSKALTLVQDLVDQETEASIRILAQLRDDPKTPAAARIAACKEIISRSSKLRQEGPKEAAGITIVIEGDAAVRLDKMAAYIDTMPAVPSALEVVGRVEREKLVGPKD